MVVTVFLTWEQILKKLLGNKVLIWKIVGEAEGNKEETKNTNTNIGNGLHN